MNVINGTISILYRLLADSTALDRWKGMRNVDNSGGARMLFWVVIAITVTATVLLLCTLVARSIQTSKKWSRFDMLAASFKLELQQRKLLRYLAELLELKDPNSILTSQGVFDQGVARLMQDARTAKMPPKSRSSLGGLLDSIREVLGFSQFGDNLYNAIASSRQVVKGSDVYIVPPGVSGSIPAKITESSTLEFDVETERPLQMESGQQVRIRFPGGPVVWEFNTTVVSCQGNKACFNHTEEVHAVNRRRFPRVQTDKHAHMADFPFTVKNPQHETPEFLTGRLKELGGPGAVLLQSNIVADVGDKILVTIKFSQNLLVQGVARVRRKIKNQTGDTHVAVELVGLDSNEMSELIRQTNLAAAGINEQPSKNNKKFQPVG